MKERALIDCRAAAASASAGSAAGGSGSGSSAGLIGLSPSHDGKTAPRLAASGSAAGGSGSGSASASASGSGYRRDGSYRRLIGSRRWARLRRRQLSLHPLCRRCEAEGYVRGATEVHHVRPVEWALTAAERERLMFDEGNLESLCRSCHVAVHTELGRSGRERQRKVNAAQTAEAVRRFFGD